MFDNYENKNFHLDFWESCENGTASLVKSNIPEWSNVPEGVEKVLESLNKREFLGEGIEVDGKIYDSLEDVYHVGSYVETINSVKQLAKLISPENIRKSYPNDKNYPLDFFIQFVDPATLKRVALMIVYNSNPYELGKYDKKTGRIIVYKAKAFAAKKSGASWKFSFMINDKNDIIKARDDKDLRITWSFDPRKTIYDLSPRAIQNNVLAVVSKLNAYKIVDDNVEEVVEDIIYGTR